MTWIEVALLVALVVAVGGLVLALVLRRRLSTLSAELRRSRLIAPDPAEARAAHKDGPAVVVFNPSKQADFETLRIALARECDWMGMPEPIWLETTVEEPGKAQARQAIEMGASVVIAAGGDGTVRAVAEGLAGSGVALGLLPIGTANLLARNLGIANQVEPMIATVLAGKDQLIDVGWLEIEEHSPETLERIGALGIDDAEPAKPGRYGFLVISGLGFDAEVMGGVDPTLKKRIGWLAYLTSALKVLKYPKLTATIRTRSGSSVTTEARSVMFANCGELVSGFVMAPDAKPDDGWLDIAILDVEGGLMGWGDLVRRVGLQGIGVRSDPLGDKSRPVQGSIDFRRTRECTVTVEEPAQVQLDGDVVGYASKVSASIEPGALYVRVAG